MIDVSKGYAQAAKAYKPFKDSVDLYTSLLSPAAAQYSQEVSSAQTTRDYDISQAYANWKKSQLNLMQSNLYGAEKRDISSGLESSYKSSYSTAFSNYAKEFASAKETYSKSAEEVENYFKNYGASIEKVLPSILEYSNEAMGTGYDTADISKMFIPENQNGYGLFELNTETGEYEPTAKYTALIDKVLNENVTTTTGKLGFYDWLSTQGSKDAEDFLNYYKENPEMMAAVLGGERARDLDVTSEEAASYKYQLKDYYNKDLTFESDADKNEFYNIVSDVVERDFYSKRADDVFALIETRLNRAKGDASGIFFNKYKSGYYLEIIPRNDSEKSKLDKLVDSGTLHKTKSGRYATENDLSSKDLATVLYGFYKNKQ